MEYARECLDTGGAPAARMLRVNEPVPVPPLLDALKVMLKEPKTEGVPETSPLTESTVRPAGKPLTAKLVGLLIAVIW